MYKPTPLIYPIDQKNYQNNHFISTEWSKISRYLESAYMITIFGYSAPDSDVEARNLMIDAYKSLESRNHEQIEIIDTKAEDELIETWNQFIVSHHYQVYNNYYDSWIAKHPRRTCDAMWQQLEELQFLDPNEIPITTDWDEIREWFQPLIFAEKNHIS